MIENCGSLCSIFSNLVIFNGPKFFENTRSTPYTNHHSFLVSLLTNIKLNFSIGHRTEDLDEKRTFKRNFDHNFTDIFNHSRDSHLKPFWNRTF